MEINKYRLHNALFLIILFSVSALYAQEDEGATSFVTRTSEGFVVTQSISFPVVQNAVRYEVEIEKFSDSLLNYVPLDKIDTINTRINLSLKVGYYRFRITAYNIMGLWEGLSDWQEIYIQPAVLPVIESYQPFYGLFHEIANPTGTLIINGKNILAEAEFALVDQSGNYDFSRVSLHSVGGVIFPEKVTVLEDKAILTFSRQSLKKGIYDIFIRNPGGLWVLFGKVQVGYKNNRTTYFEFGYAPMLAAFNIDKVGQLEYDSGGSGTGKFHPYYNRFNTQGYYARFGGFFQRSINGNFGFELQANFLVDNQLQKSWSPDSGMGYTLIAFSGLQTATLNFVYQRAVTERWLNNFRFGLGLANGDAYLGQNEARSSIFSAVPFVWDIGITTQYFLWKNLAVNAGLDFQVISDIANDPQFRITPHIGFTWQFSKWAEHAEIAEAARWGEDYSVPVYDIPKREYLLSVGWAPMVPLGNMDIYSRDYKTAAHQHLQPFNPGGVSLRYAYLPIVWNKNKFGFDMEFNLLVTKNMDTLNNFGIGFPPGFDILSEMAFGIRYQRVFLDSLQLNVRSLFGIGNSYLYIYNDKYDENYIPSLIYKAGLSLQYFFVRGLYAEAGVDFTYLTLGVHFYMKPHISLGWQFNHNTPTGMQLNRTGFPRRKPPKSAPAAVEAETEMKPDVLYNDDD